MAGTLDMAGLLELTSAATVAQMLGAIRLRQAL